MSSIESFLETPFLTRKKAETLRESNVCLGMCRERDSLRDGER
jgi:hypothetical protein